MANTKAATERGVRVRVNPIRCVAFGYCAEFCPEVFTLDDWGYASLVRNDVSDELLELLNRTAALCLTGAISVETVDGQAATVTQPSPLLANRDRSRAARRNRR